MIAGTLSPLPQVQTLASGDSLTIGSNFQISRDTALNSSQMTALTDFLVLTLQGAGYTNGAGGISIILHKFGNTPPVSLPYLATFPKIGTEGYTLVVDQPGSTPRLTIAAEAEHGVFNGAMTALQLLLKDSGNRETKIKAKTIQDYPDHPIRGTDWHKIQLVQICDRSAGGGGHEEYDSPSPTTSVYCLTDSARSRIDFLARHKVNLLFYTHATEVDADHKPKGPNFRSWDLSLEDLAWQSQGGQAAYTELVNYCKARFIDVVPSMILGGSTQWENYDGWWNKQQPFVFTGLQRSGIQYNESFEIDDVDDGFPDGWTIPSTNASDWRRRQDFPTCIGGGKPISWMALHQTTARTAVTTSVLSQLVRVKPGDQHYGIEVYKVGGTLPISFQLVGVDSVGLNLGNSTVVRARGSSAYWKYFLWDNWGGQHPHPHPLDVTSETRYVRIIIEADTLGASIDSALVDEIRIRAMQAVTDTTWQFISTPDYSYAVPGRNLLTSNIAMEQRTAPHVLPDTWSLRADGWGDSTATTRVSQDTTISHSGEASARLCIPVGLDSTAQNNIIISQVMQAPTSTAGTYRLTAWVKASWTRVSGSYPELNLYATNSNGSVAEHTGRTIDCDYSGSAPGDTTEWLQYQTDLTVTANRDKFVVYAYIRAPSYGTIWLDDVSLIQLTNPLPLKELASNPSMELGSGLPTGFHAVKGFQGLSAGSNTGWSRISATTARTGSHVLQFYRATTGPGDALGQSFRVGQSSNDLPPGRFLLTAWVKAGSGMDLKQPPVIQLYTDSTQATARGDADALSNLWNTDNWTKLHAILNVQSNTDSLWFSIRTWQSGTCYVDDVSLRFIDGDLHNIVDRVYKPVVQSTDLQTTYVANSNYAVWRSPLAFRYDETAVPTRILWLASMPFSIKVSYDQHLFWDYELAGWQSRNLCATCSTGVLRSLFNRGSRRVLALGASGIHMDLSELRGLNRSGISRKDSHSNAWVLGRFAHAWYDTIHAINANAVVYESGDMISPYANGARRYESDWGGTSDPTYLVTDTTATAATDSAYLLPRAVRAHSWFYYPKWFAGMSGTARWFQKNRYAMTQDTWYDTTNVMEAAAVSRNLSLSLGSVATTWVDPNQPLPPRGAADEDSLQQRWIRTTTNRFWNTPWRQVYFTDFNERTWPDSCRSCTGTARYIRSSAPTGLAHLFAPSWPSPLHSWNDGGMLFAAGAAGSVVLPKVFVDNGSAYTAIIHHRSASGQSGTDSVSIVSRWYKYGVSTPDSSVAAAVNLAEAGDSFRRIGGPVTNFFNRKAVSLARPTTSKYDQLQLKIRVNGTTGITLRAQWHDRHVPVARCMTRRDLA